MINEHEQHEDYTEAMLRRIKEIQKDLNFVILMNAVMLLLLIGLRGG